MWKIGHNAYPHFASTVAAPCSRCCRGTGFRSVFDSRCQRLFRPGCSPVSFHGVLLQVSIFSRNLEPSICVMIFAPILDELLDDFLSSPIPFESRKKRVLISCLMDEVSTQISCMIPMLTTSNSLALSRAGTCAQGTSQFIRAFIARSRRFRCKNACRCYWISTALTTYLDRLVCLVFFGTSC